MTSSRWPFLKPSRCMGALRVLALVLASSLLAGCGGMFAYRDGSALIAAGDTDRGLVRLEEAVRLEPRNPEYRMVLINQRQQASLRWLQIGCKTACKTFQISGVISVQKLPPWVV